MTRKPKHGKPIVIEELDIPIFFIKRLGDRQFVVGGGGGAAKSGVPNAVYIFTLTYRNGRCGLRQCQKVDQGLICPMNVAVYETTAVPMVDARWRTSPTFHPQPLSKTDAKEILIMLDNTRELIAVGLDNNCAIYHVDRTLGRTVLPDSNMAGDPRHSVIAKEDLLSIDLRETIETISGQDASQQCCGFAPPDLSVTQTEDDNKQARLITGGSDGILRLWNATKSKQVAEFKAHDGEVVDMDLSSSGDEIVTCGKDKQVHVWYLKSREKAGSALPEFPEAKPTEYRPRKVRFHAKNGSVVYVVWIPIARQRKRPHPSVLCAYRFNRSRLGLIMHTAVKGDQLSALAISPDGYYLAAGNLDGSVFVFRTENLGLIYSSGAHETFVTGLEFTHCAFGAKILTQTEDARCSLFSVSADRRIILHQTDFDYGFLNCRKYVRWMKWLPLLWILFVALINFFDNVLSLSLN